MKKALVIGIDDYPTNPLAGCVNDAKAIGSILARNGDGSPNFSVLLLTSDKLPITSALLESSISDLFKGDADTALLFFAGHGIIKSYHECRLPRKPERSKGRLGYLTRRYSCHGECSFAQDQIECDHSRQLSFGTCRRDS
jgi:Caspase domain